MNGSSVYKLIVATSVTPKRITIINFCSCTIKEAQSEQYMLCKKIYAQTKKAC